MAIALVGLLASIYVAAEILYYFYAADGMTIEKAWIYATPLSILSSAIIIPSVTALNPIKREFHIYESTFSDILGIIVFYYLTGQLGDAGDHGGGLVGYGGNVLLTIVVSCWKQIDYYFLTLQVPVPYIYLSTYISLVNILSADALSPIGARPPVDTMLTIYQ